MVSFKKAEINDWTIIQKIAHETWPFTFGEIIAPEQINYMLEQIYNEDSLKIQMLEKGHNFILAEKDGHSLGFTSYEINYNSEKQIMIHKLYILPDTQGMGLGTKFLNKLSEIALENNNLQLCLKVFFRNVKAIGFYEKFGFKKIGTKATDIGNNYKILDYIMVKVM